MHFIYDDQDFKSRQITRVHIHQKKPRRRFKITSIFSKDVLFQVPLYSSSPDGLCKLNVFQMYSNNLPILRTILPFTSIKK